jgi:hypothetical protein
MKHKIQAYLSFVEKLVIYKIPLSKGRAGEHATTPDLKVNHCIHQTTMDGLDTKTAHKTHLTNATNKSCDSKLTSI